MSAIGDGRKLMRCDAPLPCWDLAAHAAHRPPQLVAVGAHGDVSAQAVFTHEVFRIECGSANCVRSNLR